MYDFSFPRRQQLFDIPPVKMRLDTSFAFSSKKKKIIIAKNQPIH